MKKLFLPSIKKIEYFIQSNEGHISFAQGALRIGGVPTEARTHLQKVLETDQADYYGPPAGRISLRKALADHFKTTAPSLTEQNILVSHGSIGGLMTLCCTYLTASDKVLIPTPAYPVYENVIHSSGARPFLVPAYTFDTKTNQWQLSLETIRRNITPEVKMLVISHPSNPLGTFISQSEMEELLAITKEHNMLLVIDEAYDGFLFNNSFVSSMQYISSAPHLIRLGSFSKNAAMSGWRIGYVVAEPSIIEALIPVQDAMLCCPNIAGQILAEFMLKNPNLMHDQQKKLLQAKNIAVDFFRNKKNIQFQDPDGGFYIFFKQDSIPNDTFVLDLLDKHGVGIVPGSDFSLQTRQWSRFCFARDVPTLLAGLERINLFLNEITPFKKQVFSSLV